MDAGSNKGRRRAVGYVRVSGSGESAQVSVAAQKEAIEEYADSSCLDVVDWLVDEGDSGMDENRPALGAFLEAIEKDEEPLVEVLLVSDLSRLSRRAEGLLSIGAKLRDAGVELVSVSDPSDFSAWERRRERLMGAYENGTLDLDRLKTELRRIEAACQRRLQGK